MSQEGGIKVGTSLVDRQSAWHGSDDGEPEVENVLVEDQVTRKGR